MARTKFYTLHKSCFDKEKHQQHDVTIVGRVKQRYYPKEYTKEIPVELDERRTVKGKVTFHKRTFERTLDIAIAICHPMEETYDYYGEQLAMKRIKNGDIIGSLTTNYITMLTEDAVMAELETKLDYICNHIDDYISH